MAKKITNNRRLNLVVAQETSPSAVWWVPLGIGVSINEEPVDGNKKEASRIGYEMFRSAMPIIQEALREAGFTVSAPGMADPYIGDLSGFGIPWQPGDSPRVVDGSDEDEPEEPKRVAKKPSRGKKVQPEPDPEPEYEDVTDEDSSDDGDEYDEMDLDELRAMCLEWDLSPRGREETLRTRLRQLDAEMAENDE